MHYVNAITWVGGGRWTTCTCISDLVPRRELVLRRYATDLTITEGKPFTVCAKLNYTPPRTCMYMYFYIAYRVIKCL